MSTASPGGSTSIQYVLEVSGGFRTLGVTWLAMLEHLIMPNGGLDAWRVCIVAHTHHKAQIAIGNIIAENLRTHHASFAPQSRSSSCAEYGLPEDCDFPDSYAIQMHAVRANHRACERGVPDDAMFIRLRPDSLILQSIDLGRYRRIAANGTAVVPCKLGWQGSKDEALTDQLVVASRRAMAQYVQYPHWRNSTPMWHPSMEKHVTSAIGKNTPYFEQYNTFGQPVAWRVVLLDMPFVSSLVYGRAYHTLTEYHRYSCAHDVANGFRFVSKLVQPPQTDRRASANDTIAQTLLLIQQFA